MEESDEDDEPPSKKPSPKKTRVQKRAETPAEDITASAYFGKNDQSAPITPKKSTPKPKVKTKANGSHPAITRDIPKPNGTPKSSQKPKPETPTPKPSEKPRSSRSKVKVKPTYLESDDDDDEAIPIVKQNADDSGDDIFEANFKHGKKTDDYEPEENTSASKAKAKAPLKKPAAKTTSKTTPKKAPPKKKMDEPEDETIDEIMKSIPTVRAPTPPPRDGSKKFNPMAGVAARAAPPPGAGTKEIPEGAENCLAGLTFVFTGLLQCLGRDEGQNLVKRYGGKITAAPSSKTSFVVLGTDAGPTKLETIRNNNLKTIDEDGLFALIRSLPADGGSGKNAVKAEEKRQAEEKKIQNDAEKQEKEMMAAQKQKAAAVKAGGSAPRKAEVRAEDQLWTTKYAPTQIGQICGNKIQVEKLQKWLHNWHASAKANWKKPGPDMMGAYRTVMLHGGPGIGKTTAAHLVAKLEGYDVIETNASDTRSKKLVETGLKGVLDTTSLLGYFAGDGQKADTAKRRILLIMDEVDGMSAGDRGGVGAMASICKKTNIPIILICNDRKLPKMKPFDHVVFDLPFRKPGTDQVRSRIMTILFREGMSKSMPSNVVNALIEGSNADIRRVINMISAAKLDEEAMDFDDSKKMTNAWEKNIVLKPWDLTFKILGPGIWSPVNKATLNDKADLYFNDHEFSYLMLQENYLNCSPALANGVSGAKKNLQTLDLFDKAASSISDGDLVDAMIHGQQQHWALMPTHAIMSFVRPASFIHGATGNQRIGFTSWLGNNSKQGKLSRYVKEIQAHMRLRTSADRHEIRQQYLPLLFNRLVRRLQIAGEEAETIDEIIDLMDSYFITRDDWDYIMELGVGAQDQDTVKISTKAKSNFTRKYNAASHPVPFMKASMTVAPAAKSKEKPDLEEAIEESEDEQNLVDPAAEDAEEELDLKKDKYVSAPKKRKAPAKKAGKKAVKDENDDDDDVEDEPPTKKSKTSAKAAAAGKSAKGKGKKT